MSFLKHDDVLRKSLIGEINEETRSKIYQSTDKDRSIIEDAFIQDFDESSQVYQYEEIAQLQQQGENQKQELERQKESLIKKLDQINGEMQQIIREISQSEKKLKENQVQSDQNIQQLKQRLQQLEVTYQNILPKYEKIQAASTEKELDEIYKEYQETIKEARAAKINQAIDRQQEQALKNEIDELRREQQQIQDILNNQMNPQQLKELQNMLFQNDNTYQDSMESQLNEKCHQLDKYKNQNKELNDQMSAANQKLDNIFIQYNNQRKQIKQLQEENSRIKLNSLMIQRVSTSRSPSKIIKKQVKKVWGCFQFLGYAFGILIVAYIFREQYDDFQDIKNL